MQLPLLLSPLLPFVINRTITSEVYSVPPCPLSGQIYPPPSLISSSEIWKTVTLNLENAIATDPLLQLNTTSYSLQLASLHDSGLPFEHYNKAPHHRHGETGENPVDGDTIFRIASISKLFTVYAVLVECGFKCFEDPIAKYVPELANHDVEDPTMDVDWDEITVGALAAQLSGIGRDYAIGDGAGNELFPGNFFGFPDVETLDPSDIPSCGTGVITPPCTRKESIKRIVKHPPAFSAWYTPSYSNMAYQLLGYALENITGKSFEDVIPDLVCDPLKLKSTTVSIPKNTADAVLDPSDWDFGWDVGEEAPAAGVYSSATDLTKLGLAILNNTQLTLAEVRRWLKPVSPVTPMNQGITTSVGAPWEILHLPGISAHHQIDIYTKSGSMGTYTSMLALIPDLQVTISVNSLVSLGSPSGGAPAGYLASVVLRETLSALYEIAKKEALAKFGGTYVDATRGINSSMTVTVDDEIGLKITRWISNGTDVLAALPQLDPSPPSFRLFPTTLTSKTKNNGQKISFRAVMNSMGGACISWEVVDAIAWGGYGWDQVVFEVESGSTGATAVHLPAYRARYTRVEEQGDMPELHVQ